MKVRTARVTSHYMTIEGYDEEFEIGSEPCDWMPKYLWEAVEPALAGSETPTRRVLNFVYAVNDEYPENPLKMGDANGEIILFSNRYSDTSMMTRGLHAFGLDEYGKPDLDGLWDDMSEEDADKLGLFHLVDGKHKYTPWVEDMPEEHQKILYDLWKKGVAEGTIGVKYTQPLDIYEHGGMHISRGHTRWYPDEQWDVARGGGVWVPDKLAIENIEYVKTETPAEWEERAKKYLDGILVDYNAWMGGDVYGIIQERWEAVEMEGGDVEWVKLDNEEESCFGYYTSEYTKQVMLSECDVPEGTEEM